MSDGIHMNGKECTNCHRFTARDELTVCHSCMISKGIDPSRTLRDEIAMRALTGILSNNFVKEKEMQKIADDSYKWADAMLAARARESP